MTFEKVEGVIRVGRLKQFSSFYLKKMHSKREIGQQIQRKCINK